MVRGARWQAADGPHFGQIRANIPHGGGGSVREENRPLSLLSLGGLLRCFGTWSFVIWR